MIVWGGGDIAVTSTGGRYDPAANSWSPTQTTNAPPARYLHTAIWSGNVMVVWGGLGATGLNSGGRYDPVADSWSPTRLIGAPSVRSRHSAVWTGSEMIVWGGFHPYRTTPTPPLYYAALFNDLFDEGIFPTQPSCDFARLPHQNVHRKTSADPPPNLKRRAVAERRLSRHQQSLAHHRPR